MIFGSNTYSNPAFPTQSLHEDPELRTTTKREWLCAYAIHHSLFLFAARYEHGSSSLGARAGRMATQKSVTSASPSDLRLRSVNENTLKALFRL